MVMREILFRGKCIGEDDYWGWQTGYYVRLKDVYKNRETNRIYPGFAENDCGNFYGDFYEIDPKTIGQFTGLFDKNGERVFDGDIVKFTDTNADYEWIGKVEFGNPNAEYNWGFQLVYIKGTKANTDILCWFDMEETGAFAEVIGNIHDNPDLLNDFCSYGERKDNGTV